MKIHPVLKTAIAIFLGVFIAVCVVLLTESIASHFFPKTSANPSIAEQEEMIRTAPLNAFIIFIIGHGLSSFFGSYTAARIAPYEKKFVAGFIVGFLLLLFGLVLFISLKHPWWVSISTCISYIVFSLLAIKIATYRK